MHVFIIIKTNARLEARVESKITKTEGRMRGKFEKGTGERSPECKIR